MKRNLALLLFVVNFTVVSVAAEKILRASLIQVIANPEAFDGEEVLLTGYLELTFEGSELYLHQEDAEHELIMNGIRVRQSEAMARDAKKLNHRYVLIVGVFHAAPRESVHPAMGTIDSIKEYRLWPDNKTEEPRH